MGVVVVVRAAVAAQIGDADDEAVRGQDLCIETAQAKAEYVEWDRSECWRSYTWRIAQCPHANHRCSLGLAGRASVIQRRDGYRQGAVSLGGNQEVANVAI